MISQRSGHRKTPQASLAARLATFLIVTVWSLPVYGVDGRPASPGDEVAGLQIVDCMLPGQLRRLGTGSFLSPRRPIRTSASDCNIRGGEYVAFDRADYKTALKVWLPAAEAGDAEAQVNVGEIFEKGLGTEPNYPAAAIWYQRAAESGNRRGQFNLATLYEQGLGVEQSQTAALNWYRQAWGLPADSIIFASMARAEQEQLRKELSQALSDKDVQLELLQRQIDTLNAKLNTSASALHSAEAELLSAEQQNAAREQQRTEVSQLQRLVASLVAQKNEVQAKLTALPKLRTPPDAPITPSVAAPQGTEPTLAKGLNFGRYYALIIGNRDYQRLDKLDTSINDANAIADVLRQRYGFEVELLLDADRLTVMRTVNALSERLTNDDNLLIYYAGHGTRISSGQRESGYWLPIDADPPPNDAVWVANEFITDHLARIPARRAIVIADSCYAGLLSASPQQLFIGNSPEESAEYLRYKLPRRSRLLLTSGGDQPVRDDGGEGHSVFARVLLDKLRSNTNILSTPQLFLGIRDEVTRRSERNEFPQSPAYKIIKGAGHEVGDFFFVPVAGKAGS